MKQIEDGLSEELGVIFLVIFVVGALIGLPIYCKYDNIKYHQDHPLKTYEVVVYADGKEFETKKIQAIHHPKVKVAWTRILVTYNPRRNETKKIIYPKTVLVKIKRTGNE